MLAVEYTPIGFTKKTHGVAGELKVQIDEQFEDLFLEKDRIFLEIRGSKQPYFIEQIRGAGDLIVKFEDVKNREEALLLQSKPIFLPATEVPEDLTAEEITLQYAGVAGFMMIDQTVGEVGRIEEVLDMPQQEMAVVQFRGKEVLIPLNDQFIQSIDTAGQKLRVDLPEGLLDM